MDAQKLAAALRGMVTQPNDGYSPADAFLIGAGSVSSNAVNMAQQGYYGARQTMAHALGNTQDANQYQQQVNGLKQTQEENDKLYQPLVTAHPYAITAGEALPWIVGGVTGAGEMMGFNVADQLQQDAVRAAGLKPVSVNKLINPSEW